MHCTRYACAPTVVLKVLSHFRPFTVTTKTPREYCCIALFKMGPDRNVLAIFVVLLALCSRYCSAHEGGCTPPAGSNLTSGTGVHGKLNNGIPQQNRGDLGSEFS